MGENVRSVLWLFICNSEPFTAAQVTKLIKMYSIVRLLTTLV